MIIDIDLDQVTINGTVVPRPSSMSRTEWDLFWRGAQWLWEDECK